MLGIRSQSRPQDIMHELYRAMSKLGFVSTLSLLHGGKQSKKVMKKVGEF